jgi:hypothetical protein
MYGTSVLAPIASGLLTTINIDQGVGKASALLGFLGVAIGLGIQGPQLGVTASLSTEDISIGTAVITFGAGMGSALFGSDKLGAVLSGYNQAVIQTLYMPLALGLLTIVGTVAMERRSMNKKQS